MVKTICPICKREMKSRSAFAPVVNDQGKGFIFGRADEGTSGYTPIRAKVFKTYDEAQKMADYLNNEMGLSKEDVFTIVCSTIKKQHEEKERVRDIIDSFIIYYTSFGNDTDERDMMRKVLEDYIEEERSKGRLEE